MKCLKLDRRKLVIQKGAYFVRANFVFKKLRKLVKLNELML